MERYLLTLIFTKNNFTCMQKKKERTYMDNKIFAVLMACGAAFMPVTGFADSAPSSAQVDQLSELDQQIKEFKDARDVASMRAYEAGSDADRFLGQNWTDYRQAIRKQEMYQKQVKDLDEKIKELEAQRASFIKK